MKLSFDPGTEKWIDWAKIKLNQLTALRKDIHLPKMVKGFVPESGTLIFLVSSEWGDQIRITGGGIDFIEAVLTGSGSTSVYTFRKMGRDGNGSYVLSTNFVIDYTKNNPPAAGGNFPVLHPTRLFKSGGAYWYVPSFGDVKHVVVTKSAGGLGNQNDNTFTLSYGFMQVPPNLTPMTRTLDMGRATGAAGAVVVDSYLATMQAVAINLVLNGFASLIVDPNQAFSPSTGTATIAPSHTGTFETGFALAGAPSDYSVGRVGTLTKIGGTYRAISVSPSRICNEDQTNDTATVQLFGAKVTSVDIADDGTTTPGASRFFMPLALNLGASSFDIQYSYGPSSISSGGTVVVGKVGYTLSTFGITTDISSIGGFTTGIPVLPGVYTGDPTATQRNGSGYAKTTFSLVFSSHPYTQSADVTRLLFDSSAVARRAPRLLSIIPLFDGVDEWCYSVSLDMSSNAVSPFQFTTAQVHRHVFKNTVEQTHSIDTLVFDASIPAYSVHPTYTLYYPTEVIRIGGESYFTGFALECSKDPSFGTRIRGIPAFWRGALQDITLLSPYTFFGATWDTSSAKINDTAFGYTLAANNRYATLNMVADTYLAPTNPVSELIRRNCSFVKYGSEYYVRLVADDIAAGKTRRVYVPVNTILAGAPQFAVAEELDFPGTLGSTWVADESTGVMVKANSTKAFA